MTDERRKLPGILARIEQLIAETESAAAKLPMDDTYHGRAVEQLAQLCEEWART